LLFVPTIAIQIYTVLDKTMIGVITKDAFENGYYEQAIKISKMFLMVVTSLGTVMIPRIGFHFNKKDEHEVRRLMYRGYRFVWFLGIPMYLGLIFVCSNFVPWFFGAGYEKVIPLIQILALLILAIGINNVTGMQYLIPTQRENLFSLTVILGAVTNFILNIILIPHFQSMGAAIASVVAETMIAIVQIYIVRHELSAIRIMKEGVHYYVAGAIMALVLYFVNRKLSASIVHTLLLVLCGMIVYFSVLLVMRDEFFVSNLQLIIGKYKNKTREESQYTAIQ
jgi:O-antigen/teichoic acid export membrane protein